MTRKDHAMIRYLLAALAVTIALAGCGGNDPTRTPASTPAPTTTAQDTATPAPTREAKAPTSPPANAPSMDAADAACEAWQDAGGKDSVSIHTPEGDTTCVGAE